MMPLAPTVKPPSQVCEVARHLKGCAGGLGLPRRERLATTGWMRLPA